MTEEWKIQMGLTKHPLNARLHEVVGHCVFVPEEPWWNNCCCYERMPRRPGVATNYRLKIWTRNGMKKKINHGIDYWKKHFLKQLEPEFPLYHTLGNYKLIEEAAGGQWWLIDSDCPYEATRQYNKTLGLLEAAIERFDVHSGDADKYRKILHDSFYEFFSVEEWEKRRE